MLEEILRAKADEKVANFQKRLTFTNYEVWGIKIPELRKMSKEYANEDGLNELFNTPTICLEHHLLRGMACVNSKLSYEKKLEYLERYLDECDDWISTDVVSLKPKKDDEIKYFDLILQWAKSGECWKERMAFTEMLSIYSKKAEYLDRIIKEIKGNNSEEYYVKMAKAWLISNLYIYFQPDTNRLLEEKCLDKITQNKAICKIRDSYRVSDEHKQLVKLLRIS